MSEPLRIEDLQDLLAVLREVHFDETKWYDLGLSLRLPEPDLETIEDKYSDSHVCLRKCLSLWLKKSENALPQVLASVLDDTRISEPRAAERVRKLFCNQSNQYLMRKLTHVLITDEIVSLLYTEGLIDDTLRDELRRRGRLLFDGAVRAICLKLDENPSKFKVLADILLKCKETEPVGRALHDEWILDQKRKETQESSDKIASSGTKKQVHIHVSRAHEESFDIMRGTFGIFKDKISSILNEVKEPVEIQKSSLERAFPELTSKLSSATTTKEIVDILLDECTITNIAKIVSFVERFNCENSLVKGYQEKLKKFCSETRVDLLLDKDLYPGASSFRCEEIEIVLDWEPSEHSLEDIGLLLEKVFKGQTVRVNVRRITRGSSIIITCYAPQYLMDELCLLAQENLPVLIEKDKLTRLRFGHHTVYDKIAKDKETKHLYEEWEMDFLRKMHEKERESMQTGTTRAIDSRKRKLKEDEPEQKNKNYKRPIVTSYLKTKKPNKGPASSKITSSRDRKATSKQQ